MKTRFFLSLFFLLTFQINGFNQSQKATKIQKARLKVSATCHVCEERIEQEIGYSKGVVYANVVLKEGVLSIKYKPNKVTLEEIKGRVAALGYDCEEIKADPKAKNNLGHVCAEHQHDPSLHHHH